MHFIWSAIQKDLRRHWRDPMALILWLLIPLGVGAGISLATGGSGGPKPSALVLVVDDDKSFVSGLLAGGFNQAGDIMRGEQVELEEGRARIAKGDGSALLIIPKGFGQAVLKETPTKLTLITNPAQTILPRIAQESLEILTDGVFYAHRVFGKELRALANGPPAGASTFPDAVVAGMSVSFNQAVQRLQKYLFPPAIELQTSVDSQSSESRISLAVLFLPGLVLMSLLFMAGGLSEDVWQERMQGTLRRVAGTPGGVMPLLIGKLIAGMGLILGVSSIMLVLGMTYLALPLANLPMAIGWSVFAGAVFLILMILLQLYATSRRAGSILANSVIFPLLMIGGSMFPSEVMPRWMAALGRWTPNGWALEQLKDIVLDREDPGSLLIGFAALFIVGVVAFFVTVRRIRRAFAWS